MAQKTVLGKGLASLLPSSNSAPSAPVGSLPGANVGVVAAGPPVFPETSNKDRHLGIAMVNIDEIRANHFQPRRDFDEMALKELAQSIKTSGLIQPIVVRKGTKEGFELIAGERRLRAAKLAGLKQIPIVIRRSTDRESLELALIENVQRQDLNCIDEALAYFQLIQEFALTQEEVAERVGKDRATISNFVRLLRLPEAIIDDLKKQVLSFGHGKVLLGLDDPEMKLRARSQIIERHLSVRDTEILVETMKQAQGSTPNAAPGDTKNPLKSRFANLSRELATQWSTKVEIKGSESKGKIVFHYSSRQDLDRILEGMQTDRI